MRLSRTVAFVLVGMMSLVGLGGVWGVVLLMLPHSDYDTVSLAQSMPSRSVPPDAPTQSMAPPPVDEDLSLTSLPPPDPLPVPPSAEPASGPPRAAVPLHLEIKCDGEMEAACPEGSVEDRRRCIQDKLRHVSAPCRQRAREQLVRMKASLQHMRAACREDVRRFCLDVEEGKGAVLQCLEAHAQDVSDTCFRSLPKRGRLLQ
ncbi:MAG TPA: cysteine rich repeat-containing protein [Nitrospiraceae bacterium]|nr:cysteine rich repeat-containing protein [Nitrospiraceae bacterium]